MPSFSQGLQDLRLERIFSALALTPGNLTFVELGFPAIQTSNTEALVRRGGWSGVRFDGQCLGDAARDADANCHRAWISSSNIAELFIAQRVRRDVDYVSIDLDTIDIWVFIALVRAGFRPKVLSIEYNSNFPVGFAFAFPDAEHAVPSQQHRKWDKGCYMGSSASAVEMAAKELGYIIVDVEPGLDLFLVDAHLWSDRPKPVLTTDAIYRPFNIRSGHSALRAGAYLDFAAWRASNGSLAHARSAAAAQLSALKLQRLPCFTEHQCPSTQRVLCRDLWSVLCPPPNATGWFANPCHGARGMR